jgi:hypothetical protein
MVGLGISRELILSVEILPLRSEFRRSRDELSGLTPNVIHCWSTEQYLTCVGYNICHESNGDPFREFFGVLIASLILSLDDQSIVLRSWLFAWPTDK